ncbi:MAG TPA: hypothetical protein VGE84_07990 [Allosphingosinicella sp.]
MDQRPKSNEQSERGKRAAFDPVTGEVSGSGAGAGGGNPGEDYDSDPAAGSGEASTSERSGATKGG